MVSYDKGDTVIKAALGSQRTSSPGAISYASIAPSRCRSQVKFFDVFSFLGELVKWIQLWVFESVALVYVDSLGLVYIQICQQKSEPAFQLCYLDIFKLNLKPLTWNQFPPPQNDAVNCFSIASLRLARKRDEQAQWLVSFASPHQIRLIA